MSQTTERKRRAILNAYHEAAVDIELSESAIGLLERVTGAHSQRAIKLLKAGQQLHLARLDKAAAKLGAPYPTPGKDFSHE